MMVANPLNDVNKFGLNLGVDVCPPSEDAPQTFKNGCAHNYSLIKLNHLDHLSIELTLNIDEKIHHQWPRLVFRRFLGHTDKFDFL